MRPLVLLGLLGCSSQGTPAPIVHPCTDLPAAGTFEEVTPPEVKAGFGVVQDGGGVFAFSLDPVNQGTIYLGTLFQKFWKSTDCGATWTAIATGTQGDIVDSGMNWTLVVDPVLPNVVYTNSGYSGNGLFKSVNGGVDWETVWPPATQPELAAAFTYQFANVLLMDPDDHLHLLLTFHEACLPPHNSSCFAESEDGGVTWRLIEGDPSWSGGEGQVAYFLDERDTWLWASQSNGFWRTDDGGDSWTHLPGMNEAHLQGSQLLETDAGFFLATADGIWRSDDGAAWRLVPDTGPLVGGIVSDGTTLYANTCYSEGFCPKGRYLTSPLSDGDTWTEMPSPDIGQGGTLAYDPGHGLLYSSNGQSGFWRITLR
jgi:hypothetical protein